MAQEALQGVVQAARLVYAAVQRVRSNKEQCVRLQERVQAVMAPVTLLEAPGTHHVRDETVPALLRLGAVLRECSEFVATFAVQDRIRRLVRRDSHAERFNVLHEQLSQAGQALALSLSIQHVFDASDERHDRKRDVDAVTQLGRSVGALTRSVEDLRLLSATASTTSSTGSGDGAVWTIAPVLERARFVGRAAPLAQLDSLLRPSDPRQPAVRIAVAGMAGMGKTALAQRAAAQHHARFTNGWALDGSTESSTLAGLERIAADLGIDRLRTSPKLLASGVRSALSRTDYAGWLVLVDNVDDPDVASALADLLPNVGGCILVTTRLTDWDRRGGGGGGSGFGGQGRGEGGAGGGWSMVRVAPLSAAEAETLLLQAADSTTTLEAVDSVDGAKAAVADVVGRLGGLPLALTSARTYLQQCRLSWDDYVNELQVSTAASVLATDDQTDVRASLQLSLAAAQRVQPVAVPLLYLFLSLLHADMIPRRLLVNAYAAAAAAATVTVTANAAVGATNCNRVLAILADYSIVTLTPTTVSLHHLMHDALVQSTAVASRTQSERLASAAAALVAALGALVAEHVLTDAVLMRQVLVHATHVCAALNRAIMAAAGPVTPAREDAALRQTVLALAAAHRTCADINSYTLADHATACREYARALALYERPPYVGGAGAGGVDVDLPVARTLRRLALAHRELGQFQDSLVLVERATAILARLDPPDYPEWSAALRNLGQIHERLGDHARSLAFAEQALAMRQQHPPATGDDSVELGWTLEAVANAAGAMGDHVRKRQILLGVLASYETRLGPGHTEVARVVYELGNAAGALGDHAAQRAYLQRALASTEAFYGLDHLRTARVRHALGNAEGALGNSSVRIALLRKVSAIYEAVYGPAHTETATAQHDLGCALLADPEAALPSAGAPEGAKTVLERCLAIRRAALGSDHILTRATEDALARATTASSSAATATATATVTVTAAKLV